MMIPGLSVSSSLTGDGLGRYRRGWFPIWPLVCYPILFIMVFYFFFLDFFENCRFYFVVLTIIFLIFWELGECFKKFLAWRGYRRLLYLLPYRLGYLCAGSLNELAALFSFFSYFFFTFFEEKRKKRFRACRSVYSFSNLMLLF